MEERWDHRADLAEQAIQERHARRLWGIPRTNLGVISWPPTSRDKYFYHWHYWWQAQYLDCQIDAIQRRHTRFRSQRIHRTMRGMRLRNLRAFQHNNYYDDKAWLALAAGRMENIPDLGLPSWLPELEEDIIQGVDSLTGVLPWRRNETFYNVPTNAPVAIMLARRGTGEQARQLIDWIFDNLINEDGLVMDGIRMKMHGPEAVTDIYSYCQGVVMGACVEMARLLRKEAGVDYQDPSSDVGVTYITRTQHLVEAVATKLADPYQVIQGTTNGGDGGLFNGILVRYLALVAESLPSDDRLSKATRRLAKAVVLRTAESVWTHRLEVDGLPIFAAHWSEDAILPQTGGLVGATIAGAVHSSDIAERDFSVQLSGWMLMEAAARVVALPD